MAYPYLSQRGVDNANELITPWRFSPKYPERYNKETNPNGIITFSMSENCYLEEEIVEFVKQKVHFPRSSFNYSGYNGGPLFPGLMASHINTYFSPCIPITPDNIITSAGVCPIQSMIALSIAEENDGVLVNAPIYGRFEMDYKSSANVKIIYAQVTGIDPFSPSVVERFEDALRRALNDGIRIKGLLIVNPNNPLGHCYPRETLKALMAFCQRHTIHLISDEIYALSVFSAPKSTSPQFTSVLSIETNNLIDQNLVHVLYGMSKDFGLAGLKIGCLITNNKILINCCKVLLRFHSSSGPSLEIACAILQRPEFVKNLLALSRERVLEGYEIATSTLDAAGIPYYRGGNAGFFLYINLSRYLGVWDINKEDVENPEFALAQHLKDHGIFLHPQEEHNEIPGWFRLVFASMPYDDLKVGLGRLISALRKIDHGADKSSHL